MSLTFSKKSNKEKVIPGFNNLGGIFEEAINADIWSLVQEDFNASSRILTVGSVCNLVVCEYGAIDIVRLTINLLLLLVVKSLLAT
tara:strand:- start:97 stop:354 length:258 start_codon:yes stop_codon:yes gene_type:complete